MTVIGVDRSGIITKFECRFWSWQDCIFNKDWFFAPELVFIDSVTSDAEATKDAAAKETEDEF